jgi:translation initiation factor IF-3
VVKEIRFHPNTDTHDLEFKSRHLIEFLIQGHKVKATVIFIGRMMVHQEIGRKLLENLLERLLAVGKIEQSPKMEGRNMSMMLIPDRKKIEQYKKNIQKQEISNNQQKPGESQPKLEETNNEQKSEIKKIN